jgi:hypothetical protein
MQVTVKLLGFRGFPEVESALVDGVLVVSVADDATAEDLMHQLAVTCGPMFEPKRFGGATAVNRLSVFVGNEFLEDLQVPLADKVRPGVELAISMLRPLRGG